MGSESVAARTIAERVDQQLRDEAPDA